MNEQRTGSLEAEGPITRESLQPPSMGGTQAQARPEAVTEEVVAEEVATEEALAEAQDTEQAQEAEEVQEAVLGRMRLNEFLDAAGVSMEEFYRDVVVDRDGKEVSVSQAWDDYKSVKDANDALLRERHELQEKVQQSAAQMPMAQQSPEAMALMSQAQVYRTQLQGLMQAEQNDQNLLNDPSVASQKVNLDFAIRQLEQQAAVKQNEHMQGYQQQVQKAINERDVQTRSRIKEWNDPAIVQAEWTAISDMLRSYGIEDTNISGYSPNVRHLLRDTMLARNAEKRIIEGAKKVRKLSKKTLSAGSRSPSKSATPDLGKVKHDISEARKAGKTRAEIQRMRLNMPLP